MITFNKISFSAGHSTAVRGATGYGQNENALAWALIQKIKYLCAKNGIDCRIFNSNATTQDAYLKEQVQFANTVNSDLAVQIHFNAGGGTGTECYYMEGNTTTKALASALSANVAQALRLPDRGEKTKDLYFIKNTSDPALLLEVCFIDNAKDVEAFLSKIDAVAKAIFTTLTGINPSATATASKEELKAQIRALVDQL